MDVSANAGAGHNAGEAAHRSEFDLSTGAQKLRWNLPGDNSTCNDFSVGPDKALYISDTANSKIYKLPAGASTAELFLEDRALYGIDADVQVHDRTGRLTVVPIGRAT